ncbi:MAG: AIR carboxylase family protein, partial [Planctomycetota bacterium]
MDEQGLKALLERFRSGELDIDQIVQKLRRLPFEDLGFAKVDHHRAIRCGFPEVIYCEGKTVEQLLAIIEAKVGGGGNVLGTRASQEMLQAVGTRFPEAECCPVARTVTIRQRPAEICSGTIASVAAGTSDLPVAEEARVTAEIMDQATETFYDVGVAGIHRLLAHSEALQSANVL